MTEYRRIQEKYPKYRKIQEKNLVKAKIQEIQEIQEEWDLCRPTHTHAHTQRRLTDTHMQTEGRPTNTCTHKTDQLTLAVLFLYFSDKLIISNSS